ncbi:MAG: ABC transporter substrate-binding protein [Propionibacteriaceae bacterium]|jgi:peptide/nickel transport system substrate-binding protein|nr:ABC transporter substrate-binding protein [Propionibacteriaceae bacterium]
MKLAKLAILPLVALVGCATTSPEPISSDTAAQTEAPAAVATEFTLALSADPGALDPSMSPVNALMWASRFAYDTLVNVDLEGNVHSGLASDWKQEADKVTFTIPPGRTCSDGSEFTAQTAADNINFVADPANESPLLGAFLPAGATATAEGGTLTLNMELPSPFVLSMISDLYMVCDAGLADRSMLASATLGTGPYVLTEAIPNDHYTYAIRDGYSWGPDATTNVGLPETVVLRVVENETTAANLLLNGEINAAMVVGADADRLDAAGLYSIEALSVMGEQWYNQGEGHVGADPAVRQALATSVDLTELRQVLTSGKGSAPTTLSTSDPVPCPGDSISAALPAYDPEGAKAALDAAGWKAGADGVRAKDGEPLAITFMVDTALGDPAAAAAELAVAAWTEAGFQVDLQQLPTDQASGILFGTGAWDVAWEPLQVSSPDQIMPYLTGPGLADGGTNFSNIANTAYDEKVAAASAQLGTAGCADWLAAETELIKANNLTVFANNLIKVYGNGATFEHVSTIVPTSIRMTA